MSAMQAMRFNASTPLYIASGLLTYNDTATFDGVARRLCGAGLCSRAVAKEHLLPPQDLQGAPRRSPGLGRATVGAGRQMGQAGCMRKPPSLPPHPPIDPPTCRTTAGLHSEQLALLDLLALTRAAGKVLCPACSEARWHAHSRRDVVMHTPACACTTAKVQPLLPCATCTCTCSPGGHECVDPLAVCPRLPHHPGWRHRRHRTAAWRRMMPTCPWCPP